MASSWEQYRPYLRAVARARLGADPAGRDRVEDLVQQTLLAAYESLHRGRGPCDAPVQVRAWLRRILINQDLKQRAQEQLHGLGLGGAGRSRPLERLHLVDRLEPPDAGLDRAERAQRLALALRTLGRRDRRVLLWRLGRGLTLAELGARLGMSPAGAQKALRLAISRLRTAYLQAGDPAELV